MAIELSENNKQKSNNEDAVVKPDPETLHSTDPQEHMEGPLSSLVKKTGEVLESDEHEDEVKKETDI
ncbi:MAG: hypothetical protein WKF97_07490 [Chitinophagaceae bacterium]